MFGWLSVCLSSLMFLEAVLSGFDNIPRKQKAFGNFAQAPAALAFAEHIPFSPKQQVKNSLKVWDEAKLVTRMDLEARGLAVLPRIDAMWNVIASANSKPVDGKPSGRAGVSQFCWPMRLLKLPECQTQLRQSKRKAVEGSCVTGQAATEPAKMPKAREGLPGGAHSRPARPRRKLGQAGRSRVPGGYGSWPEVPVFSRLEACN